MQQQHLLPCGADCILSLHISSIGAVQGAGQMLGAVLAFTAELQPLPPSNIIRSVETVIPLSSAAVAWPIWLDYLASTPFTSYVETVTPQQRCFASCSAADACATQTRPLCWCQVLRAEQSVCVLSELRAHSHAVTRNH